MKNELRKALGEDAVTITEENIVQKLNEHDACRTPGEWIGDTIFQQKLERYHRQELYLA
jgi:hypothetical protein